MSCELSARLVPYWLGELPEAEAAAVEEHLFEHEPCLAAAEGIADLVAALRGRIPSTLTAGAIQRLEERGVRMRHTRIAPGEHATVPFGRDVDILVHRLQLDTRGIARLDVELANAADGAPIMALPDLVFEPAAGEVNLVCMRHYVERFPPDAAIRLVAVEGPERRVVGEYGVMHVLA